LRTENSYLKGQDILHELYALPPLRTTPPRSPTPPLVNSSSDADSDDDESDSPRTPPTLRALAAETKLLYRDVIRFNASPRVVDLSAGPKKGWVPRKQMPAYQVLERKTEAERLGRRVKGLLTKASALGTLPKA
jgi:dynactin 1